FVIHHRILTARPSTELHPLSLHDALPILMGSANRSNSPKSDSSCFSTGCRSPSQSRQSCGNGANCTPRAEGASKAACRERSRSIDRKSTRLNSSHVKISYAVFCLKKKRRS